MPERIFGVYDAAYYLNLDSRGDRRSLIETDLRSLNIKATRISAFRPDIGSRSCLELSAGQYGCKVSHIEAILLGIRDVHRSILIMEDDVRFHPKFLDYVDSIREALETETWDLFFYYATSQRRYETVAPGVCRAATALTHCYGIHSRAYFRVLSRLLRSDRPIDLAYRELALKRELTVLAPSIDLAFQRNGFSDILGCEVDESRFHLEQVRA